MKILNKLGLAIILAIILVICRVYTVEAFTITKSNLEDVGAQFLQNDIKPNDLIIFDHSAVSAYEEPGSGVYCIEKGQKLTDQETTGYRVVNKIHIDDDISTDANATIKTRENAVLAYLISASDDSSDINGSGDANNKNRGPVQIKMWEHLLTWYSRISAMNPTHYIPAGMIGEFGLSDVTADQSKASQELYAEAVKYAETIKAGAPEEERTYLADNTGKTIYPEQESNSVKLGPFTYTFMGNIQAINVFNEYDQWQSTSLISYEDVDGNPIALQSVQSGQAFYINVKNANAESFSKIRLEVSCNTTIKTADLWFLSYVQLESSSPSAQQKLVVVEPGERVKNTKSSFEYAGEPPSIIIQKVVEGFEDQVVEGAIFEITYLDQGESQYDYDDVEYYVYMENGVVKYNTKYIKIIVEPRYAPEYVDTIDRKDLDYGDKIYLGEDRYGNFEYREADSDDLKVGRFITNIDGQIKLPNVKPGIYTARELEAPHGFSIIEEVTTIDIRYTNQIRTVIVKNKLNSVAMEGVVWEDEVDGKTSTRNNLYDVGEKFVEGVLVELYEKSTGSMIGASVTDKNGKYVLGQLVRNPYADRDEDEDRGEYFNFNGATYEKFYMDVDDLDKYEIRFTYDGFVYQSVTPNLYAPNGSKAGESYDSGTSYQSRPEYNDKFESIQGNGYTDPDTGYSYNGNSREFELRYEVSNHTADLIHGEYIEELNYNHYIVQNHEHDCSINRGDDVASYRVDFSTNEITNWVEVHDKIVLSYDPYKTKDVCYSYPIQPNQGNEYLPDEEYMITASTELAGHDIRDGWNPESLSIEDVNLGLFRREQPDFALVNDLHNVRVEINQQQHVYEYNERVTFGDNPFDVNLRQEDYYNATYQREIYESDYSHVDPRGNTDNEMEIYVTYAVNIKNQASTVQSEVISFVSYFDSRFKLVGIGKGLSDKGNIEEIFVDGSNANISSSGQTGYNKVTVQDIAEGSRLRIDAGQTDMIYLEFRIPTDTIEAIMNSGNTTLNNVVEITEYTTYDSRGDSYAGVDKDSNPGNANWTDTETYEDDTDRAPGLKLSLSSSRTFSGTVFEDQVTGGLQTDVVSPGVERKGDGIYNDGENGIGNVQVIFREPNGMRYEMTTVSEAGDYEISKTSNEEGNERITKYVYTKVTNPTDTSIKLGIGDYYFTGYVPGNYIMTYVWGDNEYQVNNYKGTNYNYERFNITKPDGTLIGDKWHVIVTEDRYTDAMDHYNNEDTVKNDFSGTNTRESIDEQLKDVTYDTDTSIKHQNDPENKFWDNKLLSSTPVMGIGVEHNMSETTNVFATEYNYEVIEVDFGIVERPIQDVTVMKRVETLKLTLATGQTFIDITIDENGVVTGQNTAAKVVSKIKDPNGAEISIEMDNEILQGSTLEVGYRYDIKNNSEVDYVDINYYKYGRTGSYDQNLIVKFLYTEVIDYLDKDWAVDLAANENNDDWVKEDEGYLTGKTEPAVYATIDNKTYEQTDIENYLILSRDAVKNKDALMKPGDTITYKMDVSKILTSANDIELDNEFEIINLTKTGGSEIQTTVGNYVPGGNVNETDDDKAEHISIIPPPGANLDYTTPIIVVVISLGVIIIGIFVIRKVVLKSKKQ